MLGFINANDLKKSRYANEGALKEGRGVYKFFARAGI